MTGRPRALALVESPVQLLHLLEWSREEESRDIRVAVLAPKDGHGRAQLTAMRHLAVAAGMELVWLEPRSSRQEFLRARSQLRNWLGRAEQVVIGDPFSGLIQSVLSAARNVRITLVDDGTATIDFVELIRSGQPLVRWAARHDHGARLLRDQLGRRATRLMTHRPAGSTVLFTVMPLTAPSGMVLAGHSYAWTREHFGPPSIDSDVTVVGSTLPESGVLLTEAYTLAITSALRRLGTANGRYLAHRRESNKKLQAVAETTGLDVVRPALPLEIELRRGPIGRTVICFPSTPAYTLPHVLSGTEVSLQRLEIEPDWLDSGITVRAKEFLARLGSPDRPVPWP